MPYMIKVVGSNDEEIEFKIPKEDWIFLNKLDRVVEEYEHPDSEFRNNFEPCVLDLWRAPMEIGYSKFFDPLIELVKFRNYKLTPTDMRGIVLPLLMWAEMWWNASVWFGELVHGHKKPWEDYSFRNNYELVVEQIEKIVGHDIKIEFPPDEK